MALSDILYNEVLRMRDRNLDVRERELTAKILANKVLVGFLNDWQSYSTADQYYGNDDAQYLEFIGTKKRLEHHLEQFIEVANEISSTTILPDVVPNKLVQLAADMRPIIFRSSIVSADAWVGNTLITSQPNSMLF